MINENKIRMKPGYPLHQGLASAHGDYFKAFLLQRHFTNQPVVIIIVNTQHALHFPLELLLTGRSGIFEYNTDKNHLTSRESVIFSRTSPTWKRDTEPRSLSLHFFDQA